MNSLRHIAILRILTLPLLLPHALAGAPATAGAAQSWSEIAELAASDGAPGDFFGISVTLSGDTALVGASRTDDPGFDSGSAYVFERSGEAWTEQAKLQASDGVGGDSFGRSVALSGDTALVGAVWDNGNGSAYAFVKSGEVWTEQAKLLPGDGSSFGDNFGNSVALSGDTALVGVPHDSDNGSDSGSAYVFVRSGGAWTQQAKLLPNDGSLGDRFGFAVALSGNTALIGSFLDDDAGSDSGSAYVFVRSGGVWTQQDKLLPGDNAAGDRFGSSVALLADSVAPSDGTALIGTIFDGDNGTNSGSAYVFVRSGGAWTEQAKLLAGDGAPGDMFGYSVALSGDTALVGASGDNDNGSDSGSAYVFVRSGGFWTEQAKLLASDGFQNDRLGYSAALSGDTALLGAIFDDDNGNNSGSAYIFGPPELFEDGFESGDTSAWSVTVP